MTLLRVYDDDGELGTIRIEPDRIVAKPAGLRSLVDARLGQGVPRSLLVAALDGWSNGVVRIARDPDE